MRWLRAKAMATQNDQRNSDQTTVLLCDDYPLFLLGLKTFLEEQNNIHVVGEATDPGTLLSLTVRLKPHIVIMDMSTVKKSDFKVLHRLGELCPETKVIIIVGHYDPMDLVNSIKAGAQGYLLKSSDPSLILKAIATIRDGKPWIQREFTPHLFDVISGLSKVVSVPPIQTLSLREHEILKLVAEGLSNKEIANKLHLSVQTVKVYLTRIFHKLNVRNRVEAAQYALFHMNEWTD
ncbi:MAG: LuxR C-terminal-related transcriptional regulator [Candidatus Fervidibacter sp.]|uniref:LuxR C-terminal-related transcriptional regulator n=1 Tax=Candidatus Fervidibacter sp. TaxID=3100871 RepID=UPI004049C616